MSYFLAGDLDDNYFLYLIAIGFVIFALMLFIFLLVNRIRVEKARFGGVKLSIPLKLRAFMLTIFINYQMNRKPNKTWKFSATTCFLPGMPPSTVKDFSRLWIQMCQFTSRLIYFATIADGNFHWKASTLGQFSDKAPLAKVSKVFTYVNSTNLPFICTTVYKASAYGLKTCTKAYSHVATVCESNQCGTEVAVKMLKHCATMEQLKSLLSELKVLNYIGSHVNIVNLLGACTANLVKGELYVLMEYCCHGNLQQYLTRNRHRFARKSNVSTTAETSVESEISVSGTDKEDTHRGWFD